MFIQGSGNSVSHTSTKTSATTPHSQTKGQFAELMATYQQGLTRVDEKVESTQTYAMDTSKGKLELDLDQHLNAKPSGKVSLDDIPLLLPTAHNVNALSQYSEAKFKDLLKQYNIPSPPSTIEFDAEGKMVLPEDYPHAAQLKQALAEKPDVETALRTTAAIASHYAGLMEGQPFQDEMSTARTQADRDRIVQKYSHLFDDNRQGPEVFLSFLEDGSMLLSGKNIHPSSPLAGKFLPK